MANESVRAGNQSRAVSKKNSTTTALSAHGMFTGTKEEVTEYASLTCMVYADRHSAGNGVKLQFSMDGELWINMQTYTLDAGEVKVFNLQVAAQFYRVVFVNNSLDQGVLQIQTIYHAYAQRDALNNINVVDGAIMVNNVEADDDSDDGDMEVVDERAVAILLRMEKLLKRLCYYNGEAHNYHLTNTDIEGY